VPKYEIEYVEVVYADKSRRIASSTGVMTSVPFEAADEEEAVRIARALLEAPSENPLVYMKLPLKLVHVVVGVGEAFRFH
jgi:hypothetical protein